MMETERFLQKAPHVQVIGNSVFFSAIAEVIQDGKVDEKGKVHFQCRISDGDYSCRALCTSPGTWKDKVKQGAKFFLQGTVMYVRRSYDDLTLNAVINLGNEPQTGVDPYSIIKKYE